MSASREKRTRQDVTSQGPNEKQIQQRAKDKKDHSNHMVYTVTGVIVAVVIAALLVWNSNIIQSSATAATINGEKYAVSDVQFYYTSARQYQAYMAMMGMSTYNPQLPAADQVYSEASGQTWHDYFLEQAVTNLTHEVALADAAEKAGHTLSAEGQADVDNNLASLETNWISSGYADRATYLRANYGSTMKYDTFVKLLTRSALAADYANAQAESYTYDQAALDTYYAEHKDEMDTFTLSQFVFQAKVTAEKDADGNPVEMTDEETAAALETAKQETKAKAEELLSRLKAGEDAQKLADEYEEILYSATVSDTRSGDKVNSEYDDWAFDAARKNGDTTLVEYAGGSDSVYNYCVVRFEGRTLDDAATANVRHALIEAGKEPTDEEYAEAKKKAEELLAQWQADGATEEAFAEMVTENSADAGSASKGGLMNVSTYDGYVDTFTDWSLDAQRQEGDTGIIQNTGSSTKGYHIMYFVGWDDPKWMQNAENALRSADVSDWREELYTGYTAENGSGLKYVG